MFHRVEDTALERIFEPLPEEGFDGMSQALEVLLNEIIKVERSRQVWASTSRLRPENARNAFKKQFNI